MISGLALFPGGVIGAGLLLLRISVASTLIMITCVHCDAPDWVQFLSILAAASLCAGLQTRIMACLSIVAPVFALFASRVPLLPAALHAMDALALVLTGAGAWSADAVMFGRRVVTLPDRNDTIV
jgi:hypothetical protein